MRARCSDELGARYPLLSYYLDQFDLQPARDLVSMFADEQTATWLYSSVLLAYRDEQQETPATRALVTEALTANPHVPAILARTQPDEFADEDETIPPGSAAEATEYAAAYEAAWTSTPGAVAWLQQHAGS